MWWHDQIEAWKQLILIRDLVFFALFMILDGVTGLSYRLTIAIGSARRRDLFLLIFFVALAVYITYWGDFLPDTAGVIKDYFGPDQDAAREAYLRQGRIYLFYDHVI